MLTWTCFRCPEFRDLCTTCSRSYCNVGCFVLPNKWWVRRRTVLVVFRCISLLERLPWWHLKCVYCWLCCFRWKSYVVSEHDAKWTLGSSLLRIDFGSFVWFNWVTEQCAWSTVVSGHFLPIVTEYVWRRYWVITAPIPWFGASALMTASLFGSKWHRRTSELSMDFNLLDVIYVQFCLVSFLAHCPVKLAGRNPGISRL